MNTYPSPQSIGRRYVLHEPLGAGGMGAVYRATDRLTGEAVALKRVLLPPDQLVFASRHEDTDAAVALAQEFRTLASLHHPHVIRVLDYGFDEAGQPFYTMDFLEGAQTIVQAGQGQDLATRVDLLVQTLQALAYLHRQNVLHRDLKPGNVLVPAADGRVKVLDFGVSVTASRTMEYLTQTTAGTLTYLAPELFGGAPVTRASDLYAVGVMAYEMFAGRFPYSDANVAVLVSDILTRPVDTRSIGASDELAAVLERLLTKNREERYGDATEVIRDLCQAAGQPPPAERADIRESYLQASRFVGRKEMLGHLSDALQRAMAGGGSAWLIGGESGVGKSRLMDELRTLALVQGADVLRGQAVSEGSGPYHLWRDALRWLALLTGLAASEASVLKPFVPDIAGLAGLEVPDAPFLDPEATRARLFWAVRQVVRRQKGPLLLILEDLQWARSESLALLDWLTRDLGDWPLLIVGDYRDDERPHLPHEVPAMQVLKLERLSEQGIAELSASMLGHAGRRGPVLDLLQRETEGNPFILVEVVRALAEQAGQLERVGLEALPERVSASRVRALVGRRLARVPVPARPLLELAAIAGRELDLSVLRALAPELDLGTWLTLCAGATVVEVRGGRWRFTHDKLREGLLDALSGEARPGLHRQVAQAIETLYPGAEQAATLAYHWDQAGDGEKATTYLRQAGEQAAAQYANDEAIAYFSRALDLLPADRREDRIALLLAREDLYHLRGMPEAQQQDLEALRALSQATGSLSARVTVALRRARHAALTGHLALGESILEETLPLIEGIQDVRMQAQSYLDYGRLYGSDLYRGTYASTQAELEEAVGLARSAGLRDIEAEGLRELGLSSWNLGDPEEALHHLERGLRLSREIGHRKLEGRTCNALAGVLGRIGQFTEARRYLEQGLRLCRETGNRVDEGRGTQQLAVIDYRQGDYAAALDGFRRVVTLSIEIQAGEMGDRGLWGVGQVYGDLGQHTEAVAYYERVFSDAREAGSELLAVNALYYQGRHAHYVGDHAQARRRGQELLRAAPTADQSAEFGAWVLLGHASVGLGDLDGAENAYQRAREAASSLVEALQAMPLVGLARVALRKGRTEDLRAALPHVERLLRFWEAHPAPGQIPFERFEICWTCYRLLRALGDPRAPEVLSRAYDRVQREAARIVDPAHRRAFLEDAAVHHAIVAAYEENH